MKLDLFLRGWDWLPAKNQKERYKKASKMNLSPAETIGAGVWPPGRTMKGRRVDLGKSLEIFTGSAHKKRKKMEKELEPD